MLKNNQRVQIMAEIAVLTALALAFDAIANLYSLSLFPNGGSISLAMLPIMVIAIRRGTIVGVITGILVGTLQTIWFAPYIAPLNPILGYFLDYPIGYGLVGLTGLTRKLVFNEKREIAITGIIISTLIGGIARTISVTVSGIYCWVSTWWASITYNFPYMIPSIIVCTTLAVLIFFTAKDLFILPTNQKQQDLIIDN